VTTIRWSLLSVSPQVKQRLVDEGAEKGRLEGRQEGRLAEARAALRRVLARRRFRLTSGEEACIEACADLATLERWLDQAVTAPTVSKALR
jgi:predicted transposase YdaD